MSPSRFWKISSFVFALTSDWLTISDSFFVQDTKIDNYDDLEADLHYAIEKVLKKYYFKK